MNGCRDLVWFFREQGMARAIEAHGGDTVWELSFEQVNCILRRRDCVLSAGDDQHGCVSAASPPTFRSCRACGVALNHRRLAVPAAHPMVRYGVAFCKKSIAHGLAADVIG